MSGRGEAGTAPAFVEEEVGAQMEEEEEDADEEPSRLGGRWW